MDLCATRISPEYASASEKIKRRCIRIGLFSLVANCKAEWSIHTSNFKQLLSMALEAAEHYLHISMVVPDDDLDHPLDQH